MLYITFLKLLFFASLIDAYMVVSGKNSASQILQILLKRVIKSDSSKVMVFLANISVSYNTSKMMYEYSGLLIFLRLYTTWRNKILRLAVCLFIIIAFQLFQLLFRILHALLAWYRSTFSKDLNKMLWPYQLLRSERLSRSRSWKISKCPALIDLLMLEYSSEHH